MPITYYASCPGVFVQSGSHPLLQLHIRETHQVTRNECLLAWMDDCNEWPSVSKFEQGSWTDIQRDRCSDSHEYSKMQREETRSQWQAIEQREPRATQIESGMHTSAESKEPMAGNRATRLAASIWGWMTVEYLSLWISCTLILISNTSPTPNGRNMAYNTTPSDLSS